MPKNGDLPYNCKSKFLRLLRSWTSKQDKRFQVRLVRSTSGVQSNTIRFPGKWETIATLPGGWDLAHAIRLGIKPFAESGANSEALSGSQVDSPCSCRAIFESAPVAMLQSPKWRLATRLLGLSLFIGFYPAFDDAPFEIDMVSLESGLAAREGLVHGFQTPKTLTS
jgi:hypothetical protein